MFYFHLTFNIGSLTLSLLEIWLYFPIEKSERGCTCFKNHQKLNISVTAGANPGFDQGGGPDRDRPKLPTAQQHHASEVSPFQRGVQGPP